MPAGELRHRLTVKTTTETGVDGLGQPISTEETITTRWGRVSPLRGSERWEAAQVQSDVTHKVLMRYAAGITPAMWIEFRGRRLDILEIYDPSENLVLLTMLCVEALT